MLELTRKHRTHELATHKTCTCAEEVNTYITVWKQSPHIQHIMSVTFHTCTCVMKCTHTCMHDKQWPHIHHIICSTNNQMSILEFLESVVGLAVRAIQSTASSSPADLKAVLDSYVKVLTAKIWLFCQCVVFVCVLKVVLKAFCWLILFNFLQTC